MTSQAVQILYIDLSFDAESSNAFKLKSLRQCYDVY